MPCYLFTFHAYGSWMPDRGRGFVHRTRGLQPSDPNLAEAYRAKQREAVVRFGEQHQAVLVETACGAVEHLDAALHTVATDGSHVHLLVSWEHDRAWESMRKSLRYAMTRALNQSFGKRAWFSEGGSRKRVRGHEHYDYLVLAYLPDHGGEGWRDVGAVAAAEKRDARRAVSVVERFARRRARRK